MKDRMTHQKIDLVHDCFESILTYLKEEWCLLRDMESPINKNAYYCEGKMDGLKLAIEAIEGEKENI